MVTVSQVIISFIIVTSIATNAIFLTTDYLGNSYYITEANSLEKIDSAGTLLFTYNQNLYGKLQFVDASNPLKIILSYPDYGTLVIVDNTLSEIGTISLRQNNILSYRAVCFSPVDNNIWIFDEQDFKLKKFDRNNNTLIESSDMFSLIGKAIQPLCMQEHNQYLYLSDPSEGIIVFDIYGTYYQTLPFKGISKFQVRNDQLFYRHENTLRSYHLTTLEEKEIPLPDSTEVIDARIEKNRLYLLTKNDLKIYKY